MSASGTPTPRRLLAAGIAGIAVLVACTSGGADVPRASEPDPLDTVLAEAFRIDLSESVISYDYWPADGRIRGSATLRFELRPGQRRALFHFNPLRDVSAGRERAMLDSLELDGVRLDPSDSSELRLIRTDQSAEPAFEVRRDLTPDAVHELRIGWSSRVPSAPDGWFYPNFDDTEGPRDETEALWPTVSSPEESVRHVVHLRVHSDRPYTVMGSGAVRQPVDGDVQAWEIDSVRPIASHTMFFAALPSEEVSTRRFTTEDVEVTIVADRSASVIERARTITSEAITDLVRDLGPFPMPRMQILLTGWDSGMEYYGATRTGLGALRHEIAHMYFGAATVNRTWRDTWIDEAAVVWWLRQRKVPELPSGFHSDIADGRSPIAPGFDLAAYTSGARVLGEVADALGGEQRMVAFLADLHERRAFDPYTTDDLVDDVVAEQDDLDRAQLERWLFAHR
jgi:hypothetical protein